MHKKQIICRIRNDGHHEIRRQYESADGLINNELIRHFGIMQAKEMDSWIQKMKAMGYTVQVGC